MLVGVFDAPGNAGENDVRLFPIFGADPVVMGDCELDRVDSGEIGCVERVLTAGAALRLLAAQRRQRVDHRIEHRHGVELALPALALEVAADRRVDQGVEDEARLLGDIVEHAVEMAFGAHHRPEMPVRLDILELRQAGARHHVERLAGRIRKQKCRVESCLATRFACGKGWGNR